MLGFLFYPDDNLSTECAYVREQLEYFPLFNKEAFNHYKDSYDADMPIHLKDKGLEKIPKSFGFSANPCFNNHSSNFSFILFMRLIVSHFDSKVKPKV